LVGKVCLLWALGLRPSILANPARFIWFVMPGLVPGIHVFLYWVGKDVDGRDKPGHDGVIRSRAPENYLGESA